MRIIRLKNFVFAISTALLLANVLNMAVVSAHSSSSISNANSLNNAIWSGLWAGSQGQFSVPDVTQQPSSNSNDSTTTTSGTYAALGDSVAAGLGLPVATNGSSQDTQCGRSPQAYPYVVAQQMGLALMHIACSGATAGDLVSQQGVSGPNIQPQLDAAFASGTPQLITITAGANDVHWDSFLRYCYAYNCGSSTNTTLFNTYTSALQLKYYYALYDIWQRSNGSPPTVVITGYYNPLSSNCANLQQQITSSEISWLNSSGQKLNNTIADVSSRFSFVKFVPINFSGHDICSADPWVQGINDPAPFHPTAAGQQEIANSITNALGR